MIYCSVRGVAESVKTHFYHCNSMNMIISESENAYVYRDRKRDKNYGYITREIDIHERM